MNESPWVSPADSGHLHQSELRMPDVEARKNCMISMQLILLALAPNPSRSM
jgi:hypothetical protein